MSIEISRVVLVVFLCFILTGCSASLDIGVNNTQSIEKAIEGSDLVILGQLQEIHNVFAADSTGNVLNGSFSVMAVFYGTYEHNEISLLCPYQKKFDIPPEKGDLAILFLDRTTDKSGTVRKVLSGDASNITKTKEAIKSFTPQGNPPAQQAVTKRKRPAKPLPP